MKNKPVLFIILLSVFYSAHAVRIGMKFDDNGRFINPDDYLVYTALEADKGGYKNDAMWRLKDAAEFGNKHAQYYIGLLHLQKDDAMTALAWMKLAGKGIANNDRLMAQLEQQLSAAQLLKVETMFAALKLEYNFETAIERRARWKKRLAFGGSHIKGHVPIGWSTQLMNGKVVFANEVKSSLDQFVFEYRYDRGEVILKDFELLDTE